VEVTDADALFWVEPAPRPIETVIDYLETVHLVADDALWMQRRAELLTMLDGGTSDAIAGWLAEHRIVFPGCEAEVAAKIVTLAATHTQSIEPPKPLAVPKRKREAERQAIVFSRRETVYEEALTQQMALF